MKKLISFFLILSLSGYGFAAKTPISLEVSNNFPSSITVGGGTHLAIIKLTNNLPLDLKRPLEIKRTASPQSEFTYADACSGKYLKAHESCIIRVF
ncbi:MAG: hypothetical protein P1U32_08265 [Legionellaceae bacterium]|nr:hypothetical protein [Legionellaceae bacterium]